VAAPRVWKARPKCGIRSVFYWRCFTGAVKLVELSPDSAPIHFEDSVNPSLVSTTTAAPQPSFVGRFDVASSARHLLQSLSADSFLRMFLEQRNPGLLLRTILAVVLLLRLL
jgi:hypothetical protein